MNVKKTDVFALTQKIATTTQNTKDLLAKGFVLPVTPGDGLALFPIDSEVLLPFKQETPLSSTLPRVQHTGGIGFGYKIIDSYDDTGYSSKLQDGRRGRFLNTKVRNTTLLFKASGFDHFVTDDAQLASENLDLQSQAVNLVLSTLGYMISVAEEKQIIGGNKTALETIAEIKLSQVDDGAFTAGALSVIAVPLTLYGLDNSSLAAGVRLTHDEPNADGTQTTIVGGYGVKKTATITLEADKGVQVLIEDVVSAAGYAVFVGTAGSEKLVFVGPSNFVTILEPAASGAQSASALSNTDQSEDEELDYDGLFALAGHNGGVVVSMDGKPLTAEGVYVDVFENVISEIKDRNVEVTHIVMNRKTFNAYYKTVAKSVSIQMSPGATTSPSLVLGAKPTAYDSAHSKGPVPFMIDDFMPNGDILFITIASASTLGVSGNMLDVHVLAEKHVEAWARVTRSYQFGVYQTTVLACKKPSALGRIKNIGWIV